MPKPNKISEQDNRNPEIQAIKAAMKKTKECISVIEQSTFILKAIPMPILGASRCLHQNKKRISVSNNNKNS